MKVVIVEDEPYAAEAIQSLLKKLRPGFRVLASLPSIKEAVQWFSAQAEPDLVLCDIHLADGNSFEIFRKVEVKCPVIFTTAYDEYAIQAFSVNSIDYLLKPVREVALEKALNKLESRHYAPGIDINEKLQALLKQVSPGIKRFMVRSGNQLHAVPLEEVAYFLSEDGVTLLVNHENRRYVVDYTLEELEEKLPEEKFFRLNRQLLVSFEAISEVHPYFKGRLLIRVHPPTEKDAVVSSQKTPLFKAWLGS